MIYKTVYLYIFENKTVFFKATRILVETNPLVINHYYSSFSLLSQFHFRLTPKHTNPFTALSTPFVFFYSLILLILW